MCSHSKPTALKSAPGYFIRAQSKPDSVAAHVRRAQRNPHTPNGDVRGSSRDARYQGVVFTGPWAHAMRQARNAPEHPIPFVAEAKAAGVSLARYELLKFLRVI